MCILVDASEGAKATWTKACDKGSSLCIELGRWVFDNIFIFGCGSCGKETFTVLGDKVLPVRCNTGVTNDVVRL